MPTELEQQLVARVAELEAQLAKTPSDGEKTPQQSDANKTRVPQPCKASTITSEKADIPCHQIALSHLAAELNDLLGMSHSNLSDPAVATDLNLCINSELDFGTAYGLLRSRWSRICHKCGDTAYRPCHDVNAEPDPSAAWEDACTCYLCCYAEDKMPSKSGMSNNYLPDPYAMPPRRLWDLCANRVIPYTASQAVSCTACGATPVTGNDFFAVSHSWTNEMWSGEPANYRKLCLINQRHWEVPLPGGSIGTLDTVRQELLKIGAEYCWLDVLCLRQKRNDKKNETLRILEWATDVPSVGNIYRQAKGVLRYFNGLGVQLNVTSFPWHADRHWFRRAWTLQEIRPEKQMYNGGIPSSIPVPLNIKCAAGPYANWELRSMIAPLAKIALEAETPEGCSILSLTSQMATRVASNEIDKIAGLNYLLKSSRFPNYDEQEPLEQAWTRCVSHMRYCLKLELLFNFPIPRPANLQDQKPEHTIKWIPAWSSVMHVGKNCAGNVDLMSRPSVPKQLEPADKVLFRSLQVLEYRAGFVMEWCKVRKLSGAGTNPHEYGVTPMQKTMSGVPREYGFYTTHPIDTAGIKIPDGKYVLVTHGKGEKCTWVVCNRVSTSELTARSKKWAAFHTSVDPTAMVLEKVGSLLTDETRDLFAEERKKDFHVRVGSLCYFI